jgi:asparagine synthase (glutamine-hydrolysing)
MGAIFGIFNTGSEVVEEKYLLTMREKTVQYGLDGQDFYLDGNIGLGCCISKFGAYSRNDIPVCQDRQQNITLVCDALVWNRAELLKTLGLDGAVSTQALVLEAYKKWGDDCPKYLNGDFAFAVWDKAKKRLFIARDHLGVRPLYYFFDGAVLVFATDYRAILALPFIGRQIDEIKLYQLLSGIYHADPEATYFAGIRRLSQAHIMCASEKGICRNKYWTPGTDKKSVSKPKRNTHARCTTSSPTQSPCALTGVNGNIGSELSGGLDSSVVTVLADRKLKKRGKKLFALSWAPPFELWEMQPKDERVWIEQICRREGIQCEYLDRTGESARVDITDAPPTDGGNGEMNRRGLRQMSVHRVKAVLTGWGGDEGISHRASLNELLMRGYWWYYLKEIVRTAKGSPLRLATLVYASTVGPLFGPYAAFGDPNKGKPLIVSHGFKEKMKGIYKRDRFNFKINPKKHIQEGVIQSRTELLAWADADYGMLHLYPFLDFRVVDFAMSIPGHLYYKNRLSRYIFCRAFERILPEGLCEYATKEDFATIGYRNKNTNDWKKAKELIRRIDRKAFSFDIDFAELDTLLNGPVLKESPEISRFIIRKLSICYGIQRCMAEDTDIKRT